MKTEIKKFLPVLLLLVSVNFAHADSSLAQASFFKELIGKVTDVVAPKIESFTKKEETPTDTTPIEEKNICEIYDDVLQSTMDLENSSTETKQKIEKFSDSVDQEAIKREAIIDGIKDSTTLKAKEKIIFKEIRKQIDDARDYYSQVDDRVNESYVYLDANDCSSLKKEEVLKRDDDISDLKTEEATYRKQLVGGLKDKMKILQEGVKNIKK